jgi:hypothetical protein
MAELVTQLYNEYPTAEKYYALGSLSHFRSLEDSVFRKWSECFQEFDGRKSNSNTAKICQQETIQYTEFIKDLDRSLICIDDARSVLTNKHKFRVIYTDDDTYLTKNPSFEPTEEAAGASLFAGL